MQDPDEYNRVVPAADELSAGATYFRSDTSAMKPETLSIHPSLQYSCKYDKQAVYRNRQELFSISFASYTVYNCRTGELLSPTGELPSLTGELPSLTLCP